MSRVGEGTPRKLPGAKNKLFAVTHLGPLGSVKPLPACSSLVPVVPAAAQGKKKKKPLQLFSIRGGQNRCMAALPSPQ